MLFTALALCGASSLMASSNVTYADLAAFRSASHAADDTVTITGSVVVQAANLNDVFVKDVNGDASVRINSYYFSSAKNKFEAGDTLVGLKAEIKLSNNNVAYLLLSGQMLNAVVQKDLIGNFAPSVQTVSLADIVDNMANYESRLVKVADLSPISKYPSKYYNGEDTVSAMLAGGNIPELPLLFDANTAVFYDGSLLVFADDVVCKKIGNIVTASKYLVDPSANEVDVDMKGLVIAKGDGNFTLTMVSGYNQVASKFYYTGTVPEFNIADSIAFTATDANYIPYFYGESDSKKTIVFASFELSNPSLTVLSSGNKINFTTKLVSQLQNNSYFPDYQYLPIMVEGSNTIKATTDADLVDHGITLVTNTFNKDVRDFNMYTANKPANLPNEFLVCGIFD